jgi:tetratricopeptide (TPR) repeat protein
VHTLETEITDAEWETRSGAWGAAFKRLNLITSACVKLSAAIRETEPIASTPHNKEEVIARANDVSTNATLQRARLLKRLSLWEASVIDYSSVIDGPKVHMSITVLTAQWERAQLLVELEKHEEALADLERLLPPPHGSAPAGEATSGEWLAEVMELRATVLAALGRQSAAIAMLEADTETFPTRPQPLIAMAALYEGLSDRQGALAALRRASLLSPNDDALSARVVAMFQGAGDSAESAATLAEALEHLSSLLQKGSSKEALIQRAKLRVRLAGYRHGAERDELYRGASQDLDAVIKATPDNVEARLYRGCLEAKCNRKRALADLSVASAIASNDARACMVRTRPPPPAPSPRPHTCARSPRRRAASSTSRRATS